MIGDVCHVDIWIDVIQVGRDGRQITAMTHAVYALVGAAIKARRESIGMSQDVLASKVGLSRTSVTNIERGRQSVFVHQLISFAEALGIDAPELLPDELPDVYTQKAEPVLAEVAELVSRLQPLRSQK